MKKVLGVKLVTGEEIFGLCEADNGRLKISNPLQIRLMPSQIQGGQPGMAFVPFPQFADDSFSEMYIEPLHIVYQYVPYQDLITEYNNITSGETPSAPQQIITG